MRFCEYIYSYDGWGNLTNTVYSDDTPAVSLDYDAMGRQTEAHDAAGTTTFAYDAYGALTNETVTGVTGTNTIERHWDGFGRTAGYALNGERQTTIGYDFETGRITSMLAAGATTPFTWSYLPGSDLKSSLAYPNGLTASWQYDANNQLLQVSNATPTNVISQYDYTYDVAGRRISCAHSGSAFEADDTIYYGYNLRGELTNAVATVDSFYRYSYQYDDNGNRLWSLESTNLTVYVANCLNQYTAISNFFGTASTPDVFSPQYDDDGNQTLIQTETGIWSVAYNGENRPVLWSNGATNIVMAYDRMGRRVAKNGLRFIYDRYLQIADNDGNAYVWDSTEPIATRPLAWMEHTSLSYYFHDGNKNVSDAVATNVFHGVYSPFGQTLNANIDDSNPWRHSSEYCETELNLHFYNFRHYEPKIGRWLTRDPSENDLQLYLWVKNNPPTLYDYLGLKIIWKQHHIGENPPKGWKGADWNAQTEFYGQGPGLNSLVEYECDKCKVGFRGFLEDFVIHSYYRDSNPISPIHEKEHFDCFDAYYATYTALFFQATTICDKPDSATEQLRKLNEKLREAVVWCNLCNWKYDKPGGPHGH